jgi:hypothetical protein
MVIHCEYSACRGGPWHPGSGSNAAESHWMTTHFSKGPPTQGNLLKWPMTRRTQRMVTIFCLVAEYKKPRCRRSPFLQPSFVPRQISCIVVDLIGFPFLPCCIIILALLELA